MKNLKAFIDQENRMAAIFNQPTIDAANIDQEVATNLYQKLDSNLSPEHLTCDGELPPAQVRKRAALYRGAINDLDSMGFARPHMYCA